MRERFTGVVGEGAWLNGAPMRVSDIADPADGILQTGVPSRASEDSMKLFEARLRHWRKVRMIGSAATALAYVAAGRAEAYRESGSMIWDVAAGCALVKAAGGEFRIDGRRWISRLKSLRATDTLRCRIRSTDAGRTCVQIRMTAFMVARLEAGTGP